MSWNESRATFGGRVVKAGTVRLRGEDPHIRTVEDRLAEAATGAYHRGYEEGFQTGALQAGAQLAEAADRLVASILAEVGREQAEAAARRADDAHRLVDLALMVAEWAVRRELASVPDAFFSRLEALLADRDRRVITEVTVAPELAEATRVWLDNPELRVLTSDDLEVGEARVTIGDSTIFATFDDALSRARDALHNLPEPLSGLEAEIVDDTEATDAFDDPRIAQGIDDDDVVDAEEVEVLYDAFDDEPESQVWS